MNRSTLDMAHYLALKKMQTSQSSSNLKSKEISEKLQELEKVRWKMMQLLDKNAKSVQRSFA